MTFPNIFDSARSSSDAGTSAGSGISAYIPQQPNEAISVPPHDPWQPVVAGPQDPKIVRETSPQAQSIFTLVSALTAAIRQSADDDETAISDPASIVDPGSSIMQAAKEVTDTVTDNVPSPSSGP